jgi:pimeloyl-ACP methyl ester carboxylesterase
MASWETRKGVRIAADDRVTLYAESTGAGPAIVFVHEFADDLRSWEPQLRFFSSEYRCIAFNARGYPPSDVPADPAAYSQPRAVADVFAVMDALGAARAHIVGHSMGAYTALHMAMEQPSRVASVTAAGCGWGSGADMRAEMVAICTEVARLFREEGIERAALKYTDVPMRRPFKENDRRGWDAFIARLSEHSAEGSALTMLGVQMKRPTLPDLAPRLSKMTPPLLVVVGDGDEPCLDGSLLLKRTVPDAALMVVPRCGHAPNNEAPDLFNATVARHLEAHPA